MTKKIGSVMLIDDEEIDQKQYERVLKRSGLVDDIIVFSYADEALEYLKANVDQTFDIIFLDINMPRMNGFEFLKKVTEELGSAFTHGIIVMLTTSLNPKDRERALQFDIVRDFINKPLEISDVERAAEILAEVRAA